MAAHLPLVQQSLIDGGQWWVSCCDRIVVRRPDTADAWCPTRETAQALAEWHIAGETGPAPLHRTAPRPTQLALFAA